MQRTIIVLVLALLSTDVRAQADMEAEIRKLAEPIEEAFSPWRSPDEREEAVRDILENLPFTLLSSLAFRGGRLERQHKCVQKNSIRALKHYITNEKMVRFFADRPGVYKLDEIEQLGNGSWVVTTLVTRMSRDGEARLSKDRYVWFVRRVNGELKIFNLIARKINLLGELIRYLEVDRLPCPSGAETAQE